MKPVIKNDVLLLSFTLHTHTHTLNYEATQC